MTSERENSVGDDAANEREDDERDARGGEHQTQGAGRSR